MNLSRVGPTVSELYELFGEEEISEIFMSVLKILEKEEVGDKIKEIRNKLKTILDKTYNQILCNEVDIIIQEFIKIKNNNQGIKKSLKEIIKIEKEYFDIRRLLLEIDNVDTYENLLLYYKKNSRIFFKIKNLKVFKKIAEKFIFFSEQILKNTNKKENGITKKKIFNLRKNIMEINILQNYDIISLLSDLIKKINN